MEKVYLCYAQRNSRAMFIIHLLELTNPSMFSEVVQDLDEFLERCLKAPGLLELLFDYSPKIIVSINN